MCPWLIYKAMWWHRKVQIVRTSRSSAIVLRCPWKYQQIFYSVFWPSGVWNYWGIFIGRVCISIKQIFQSWILLHQLSIDFFLLNMICSYFVCLFVASIESSEALMRVTILPSKSNLLSYLLAMETSHVVLLLCYNICFALWFQGCSSDTCSKLLVTK